MGFFGRLGKKVVDGVAHYGAKINSVVKKGTKYVHDHAQQIGDIADKVGNVAGTVANIASVGAGLAAATGIGAPIAAGLGTLAAGAKAVQGGAGMVSQASNVARGVSTGIEAARIAANAVGRGDAKMAVDAAKLSARSLKGAKSGAGELRKDIQRRRKK